MRTSPHRIALLALVALLCMRAGVFARTQPAEIPTAAVTWIQPEDIVDRADELARRLDAARPGAATLAMLEKIEAGIDKLDPQLASALARTQAVLADETSLVTIQDIRLELDTAAAPVPAWKEHLAAEAKRMAEVLDEVAAAQRLWSATGARPETAAAGEAVVRRTHASVALLEQFAADSTARRARVLALNDRLFEISTTVADALDRLDAATVSEGTNLVVPDHPPLWRRGLATPLGAELRRVPSELEQFRRDTLAYLRLDARQFVLQGLIAGLLMLGLRGFPTRARERLSFAHASPQAARLLQRPYAIALLLPLMASAVFHPTASHQIRQLLGLLMLLPAARVLALTGERSHSVLFAGLCVLLVLDRISIALAGLTTLTLALFLVELGLALAVILEYRRRLAPNHRNRWLIRISNVAVLVVSLAILAEIGGWSSLAALIGRGVLACGVGALYVYATTISLEALCAYALASPTLRRSRFVDRNQPLVQRWTAVALRCLGALLWCRLALSSLGVRDLAGGAIRALLQAGVSVGALSLSIGGVLAFTITLAAAMLVGRIVHEVLEDEVFPRTDLPRGIPHALTTLAGYAIYSLGFLLALAAAGVQLSQLSILLGGLGVGIGLGLQDLVKNFAAGITLLLERRVHVGDAVQIPGKDVFGRILSIGMRASVVRNWNGAEVVMPNDELVAGAVTNWTLSDRLHRIEVPISVAFTADPEAVIELLLGVARGNDRLLENPAPSALFKGFGENSLDFVLGAWTDDEYEATGARTSELALAVHRALREAGIELTLPQREVHLGSVSARASAALAQGRREE